MEWLRSQNLPISTLRLFDAVPVGRTRKDRNAPQATQNDTTQSTGKATRTQSQVIALPTHILEDKAGTVMYPIHSASLASATEQTYLLQPWQVEGICLEPLLAMKFLTSLPLGAANKADSFLGEIYAFGRKSRALEFRSVESG